MPHDFDPIRNRICCVMLFFGARAILSWMRPKRRE
ncbi:hypothetical protein NB311A_18828 [Nitrobacter sp. Nb-311A]|nr:hypothetical protein NB311A_18828 [Nitrobacter sp. Nb-311A]